VAGSLATAMSDGVLQRSRCDESLTECRRVEDGLRSSASLELLDGDGIHDLLAVPWLGSARLMVAQSEGGVGHGQARWSRRCQAYGVGVITWQLRRRQAWRRRPGSGVRHGGIDQARWSRLVAAAWGGAVSSFGHRGAGHRPRRQAMGADKWGSGDSDVGAPVTTMANFDSLAAYYAKSSAF
jgi:hypothetical protein